MEFYELVFARRTVRRFSPEPLRQATLEKILKAGLAAPSPNNSIPWSISVITNGEIIQKMKAAVHEKLDLMFPNVSPENKPTLDKIKLFSTIFANAPVVLAIFTKPYKAPIHDLLIESEISSEQISKWRRYPELQATGALVQNMLLAATEEGIGSCWISGALVAKKELEDLLNAKDLCIETLVALGYQDSQPHPKEPLDLELYVNYIP
ncbi:MAG: nitroreductase family protein [Candidatus Rifleibacteriota bacterium]